MGGSTVRDADPHNLERFVVAQHDAYADALNELHGGRKETHWMWFIFPQCAGLGRGEMATRYAIKSLDEAQAYLTHPVLGPRLARCAEAVLGVAGRTVEEILGSPDCLKLQSCATLFALISPAESVFRRVLEKYYDGVGCPRTLAMVQRD